jgi:hypothetical protein
MRNKAKKGVIQLSAWALGILSAILLLSSPAAADYVCWPFGGVDQLIFPSCVTSGGHREMDVNVVSGVAPAPVGTQMVNLVQVGSAVFAQGQRTTANSLSVAQASDNVFNVLLQAGSALIGHVIADVGSVFKTDQTTPGTTDLVHSKVCDATTPTNCAPVSPTNGLTVTFAAPAPTPTGTAPAAISTPASSATSVTLLAANAARNGFMLCNASNQILYAAFAATATTSSYTIPLVIAATTPACFSAQGVGVYKGIITGIWAAANGNAIVTEW